MSNLLISQLVTTRISHDLIGNIGAVSNAVELLNQEDENDYDDIKNILNFSSVVLSHRLKFFRLCFGLGDNAIKDLYELKSLIENYLKSLGNPAHSINLELNISTAKIYKFIMPSVMMMADTITKNGTIKVEQTENNLIIKATSDKPLNQTKIENINKIINGQEISDNPSVYAPLYYLCEYLKECGVKIFYKDDTLIIGE